MLRSAFWKEKDLIVRTKKKPSYKLISTYKTELMGVAAISVLINEPWKYNVNYSYVGHFGGPLMGTFCFIVGSWIAEESLDKNEYSYLLVAVMVLIWPLSKMIPTIRYTNFHGFQ